MSVTAYRSSRGLQVPAFVCCSCDVTPCCTAAQTNVPPCTLLQAALEELPFIRCGADAVGVKRAGVEQLKSFFNRILYFTARSRPGRLLRPLGAKFASHTKDVDL
jgi:hypothetical protein